MKHTETKHKGKKGTDGGSAAENSALLDNDATSVAASAVETKDGQLLDRLVQTNLNFSKSQSV